ncbi:hypothetical protein X474_23765 [Dethiosulfatarculus sandiegensis]|uniref:HTH araC/xylS-type domain-containing protein n=2 Tax=Dethiosulfatarculus sandiegensis TaxID=1429043 RepID=A0A0D2IZX8_9BACT|nr:hypothetical protein X474_23765 [Dethiosulfatarculus sandiegensis]
MLMQLKDISSGAASAVDFGSRSSNQGALGQVSSISLPAELGEGYVRVISPRQGMLLVMENYRLKKSMRMVNTDTTLPMGFSFCLSGRMRWSISGVNQKFSTQGGQCDLVFTRKSAGETQYLADEPIVMLNILLCPSLLQSFSDKSFEGYLQGELMPRLSHEKEFIYTRTRIPGGLGRIFQQLVNRSCRNLSDSLFVLGKSLELVSFQMEQLDDAPQSGAPLSFESDMVLQAKAILDSHMQEPPTLAGLARMLGTNQTKLKKTFAAQCGTTVYGYLTACRMERACELLADDNFTMARIASELGFAERTHFSRAFSRYFGMPPSQYRLNLIQGREAAWLEQAKAR